MTVAIPRVVAIHEAGHCLAYWWNGQSIHRVVARAPGEQSKKPVMDRRGREVECGGLVEASNFIGRPSDTKTILDAGLVELDVVRDDVERDLLHCFSGAAAEARHLRADLDAILLTAGRGDLDVAQALLAIVPSALRLDAERRAIARCRQLVRRYWTAVQAVTDLLQQKGDVDGEEVSELLTTRTGETPSWKGNSLTLLDRRAATAAVDRVWGARTSATVGDSCATRNNMRT